MAATATAEDVARVEKAIAFYKLGREIVPDDLKSSFDAYIEALRHMACLLDDDCFVRMQVGAPHRCNRVGA
jgi:hypothetical protein